MSTRQHQDNQQNLDHHRIAQAHRGADNGFELRAGLRWNDSALDKLPDDQPHPLVNHKLRHQQQWQGHQKADVYIHVIKKRDFTSAACRITGQHRKHQQRQPGKQGNDNHSALDQTKRIGVYPSANEKLKKRAAQYQGKVIGLFIVGGMIHRIFNINTLDYFRKK